MDGFSVFRHLQYFLEKKTFARDVNICSRKKIKRMSPNFLMKDHRLFYIGPNRQFQRLVVLSEDEKTSVLRECHNNPGTGNHNGKRATRDRVIAGYYWLTIKKDVDDWVECCHHCQGNGPMKTVAPVLHSIKVKEPWEVLELDLIGPLPETSRGNIYVLTMMDLYTKWVVAEPLQSNTAVEVSSAIISKLYMFGLVRKIITDQGKEFVNQLNSSIFSLLNIQHAVSSTYHPQTNGEDERTNQNIKHALRKYINDSHNDWDLHLPAVVYGINTAKQSSTKCTPYFLLFHHHPHVPEVMNACPMGDSFDIGNAEEEIENQMTEMKRINTLFLQNIERAQARQQKTSGDQKRTFTQVETVETGDECLISRDAKRIHTGDTLTSQHRGSDITGNITSKGVATVKKGSTSPKVNVSKLRPYYRLKNEQQTAGKLLQDHGHSSVDLQLEHSYSFSGAKWEKDVNPVEGLYILNQDRPSDELMVKEGSVCLTQEDFWLLGLNQHMESNTLMRRDPGKAAGSEVKDSGEVLESVGSHAS